jgi:hypothetical protein
MAEVQATLPGVDVNLDELPVAPERTVRVSESAKAGIHLLSIAAEGVPLSEAAATLVDLVATMRAAMALADLEPQAAPVSLPVSPIAPPQDKPAAQAAVPVPQGEDVRFIPAGEITHFRRADTESGIRRVKFSTSHFSEQKMKGGGLVCWEDQQSEAVKNPLAAIGVKVEALEAGKTYSLPANVTGIKVRFKPGKDGGRPTPDRVVEVVV